MNKLELAKKLENEAELTKKKAKSVVSIFFDSILNALTNGDRVELRAFCSFKTKAYGEYTGRNPKTGESTQVKPKKLPVFKCGQELKRRMNRT